MKNEEQAANDLGWSRAYFTVLALAIMLIPFADFVALWTTDVSCYVCKQSGISRSEGLDFFYSLGITGFVASGAVCLSIIAAMFRWRKSSFSVVLSAVVLVLCVAFCLFAAIQTWTPFLGVIWRLS